MLHQNELIAFPTETVYGLGVSALSSSALTGIYVAKGRPSDNPLIVHIYCMEQFYRLAENIPNVALDCARKFWPGPLTIIVPSSNGDYSACEVARAGLKCVGIRMPSHPVALALLKKCQLPLAAPSANLSGRPSPTTAKHVETDLFGRIAGIIDGGASDGVGLESTVIECEDTTAAHPTGRITILRPGGITRKQLEEIVGAGNVELDPAIANINNNSKQNNNSTTANQPIQALPKQTSSRTQEQASLEALTDAFMKQKNQQTNNSVANHSSSSASTNSELSLLSSSTAASSSSTSSSSSSSSPSSSFFFSCPQSSRHEIILIMLLVLLWC